MLANICSNTCCRSGEFTIHGRAWEAIRSNLYLLLAAIVVSVIFFVYMLAAHGSSTAVEFVGFMMAMGNTYGVILIICLLGTYDVYACICARRESPCVKEFVIAVTLFHQVMVW